MDNLEPTIANPKEYSTQCGTKLTLKKVTKIEIYKYICNVKPTKQTSHDEIPHNIITDAAETIYKTLTRTLRCLPGRKE